MTKQDIVKASDGDRAAEAAKGRVAVYKRGGTPGQIDHPGWLAKVVEGRAGVEQALADDWSLTMTDPPPNATKGSRR